MSYKNKYVCNAKISELKFRNLIRHYALDLDAKTIAVLVNLNRNTVNRYLFLIRKRLALMCEQEYRACNIGTADPKVSACLHDIGDQCLMYKNQPVFGIYKNGRNVFTELLSESLWPVVKQIVDNSASSNVKPHLQLSLPFDSVVLMGTKKQYRIIKHPNTEKTNYAIDLVESFWGYAKIRLSKFFGIASSTFYLHLKECEFRFNHRDHDLYRRMIKSFRKDPLF